MTVCAKQMSRETLKCETKKERRKKPKGCSGHVALTQVQGYGVGGLI